MLSGFVVSLKKFVILRDVILPVSLRGAYSKFAGFGSRMSVLLVLVLCRWKIS